MDIHYQLHVISVGSNLRIKVLTPMSRSDVNEFPSAERSHLWFDPSGSSLFCSTLIPAQITQVFWRVLWISYPTHLHPSCHPRLRRWQLQQVSVVSLKLASVFCWSAEKGELRWDFWLCDIIKSDTTETAWVSRKSTSISLPLPLHPL